MKSYKLQTENVFLVQRMIIVRNWKLYRPGQISHKTLQPNNARHKSKFWYNYFQHIFLLMSTGRLGYNLEDRNFWHIFDQLDKFQQHHRLFGRDLEGIRQYHTKNEKD